MFLVDEIENTCNFCYSVLSSFQFLSTSSFTHSFSLNNNVNLRFKISIVVVRTEPALKSLSTKILHIQMKLFELPRRLLALESWVECLFVVSHIQNFYIYIFSRVKKKLCFEAWSILNRKHTIDRDVIYRNCDENVADNLHEAPEVSHCQQSRVT